MLGQKRVVETKFSNWIFMAKLKDGLTHEDQVIDYMNQLWLAIYPILDFQLSTALFTLNFTDVVCQGDIENQITRTRCFLHGDLMKDPVESLRKIGFMEDDVLENIHAGDYEVGPHSTTIIVGSLCLMKPESYDFVAHTILNLDFGEGCVKPASDLHTYYDYYLQAGRDRQLGDVLRNGTLYHDDTESDNSATLSSSSSSSASEYDVDDNNNDQ